LLHYTYSGKLKEPRETDTDVEPISVHIVMELLRLASRLEEPGLQRLLELELMSVLREMEDVHMICRILQLAHEKDYKDLRSIATTHCAMRWEEENSSCQNLPKELRGEVVSLIPRIENGMAPWLP